MTLSSECRQQRLRGRTSPSPWGIVQLATQKKLAAEKPRETHFISNEEKETWIEHYVERETAGATKRVEDAEAAVQQEQDDTRNADNAGLTNREPEQTLEERMVAIGDSLSDLASSHNREDGEDEDEKETEQGKLSEDDEPGWVMGTITKTVQQQMDQCRQKQMKHDKLTQPEREDAADNFRERDEKYGTLQLRVPTVIQLQTDDVAPAPAPTTFGELLNCLDIVPGISQLPPRTS